MPLLAHEHLSDSEFLAQQLRTYHLELPTRLLSYRYETEILAHTTKTTNMQLDASFEKYAQTKYEYLNFSPYFNTKFLLNPQKVRSYHVQNKFCSSDTGKLITFTAQDNTKVRATYFDRQSDVLVIIGPGFTNEREKLSPFIHIFDRYDLVLFDYRGHGYDPEKWDFNFFSRSFGVNPSQTHLGLAEEQEVFALVKGMKSQKDYSKVVGIGICYSAMIFAKAASLQKDLFTHLVLDGCWFSLETFTTRLSHDLKLIPNPQHGGWKNFILTQMAWGRNMLISTAQSILGVKFQSLSSLDFLPHLPPDLPLLFFHGKNDLMISRHEFELMWSATACNKKLAVITSNPHVRNHFKQKELYKCVVELFVSEPFERCVSCLENFQNYIDLETKSMHNLKAKT